MRGGRLLQWCNVVSAACPYPCPRAVQLTAVPYCSLYDHGYTSLGAVSTTEPNSVLLLDDGTYLPAHMLPHARLERAGRVQMQRRSLDAGNGNGGGGGGGGGAQAWARLRESDSCKTAGLLIIGDEVRCGMSLVL